MSPADPVPQPARTELRRVADRWRALPLDQARQRSAVMHGAAQQLADAVALRRGEASVPVPDLGPAVVLDQLAVMAFDAAQAGLAERLAEDLASVRRALS